MANLIFYLLGELWFLQGLELDLYYSIPALDALHTILFLGRTN